MALVVADRVQETTSTTGTSDYALLGAETGYQSFGSVMANSDTTYYAVVNDTDWEVGVGTYSTTGPTLARTTILESSNSDAAVDWGVGVKKIFLTYAADRSVYLNANGDLAVDGTTLFVDATNDRVGVGTVAPANRLDVMGDVPLACLFVSTTSGTTMDVTTILSGALAVGQTVVNTGGVSARITALGTGTGGVGTYTLNRDITGTSPSAAFLPQPNTLRIGNSNTTYGRSAPNGSIEFYGSNTTAAPRAVIRSSGAPNPSSSTNLDFMVGNGNGSTQPQDPAFRLTSLGSTFPRSMTLGSTTLLPANVNNGFSILSLQGRNGTLPPSGASLSRLTFSGSYVDAGTTYFPGSYGSIGYVVDGSFTLDQLPSAFTVQTRNAAGTTAERFRVNKDGNVGIGTTVLDWSTSRRAISLAGGPTVSVFNHASFTGETLYNAYVGPAGFYTYQVDGPAARVDFNGISSGVSWSVAPSGITGNNITFSQVMTLLPSGNLGIGTNGPAQKLDVNGTANATTLSIGGTAITATAAELNYVDGVTSSIQAQLDALAGQTLMLMGA